MVIVLILVLSGFVISLQFPDRMNARRASCKNNQRQIVLAMDVYANENNGSWPVRPTRADGSFATPSNLPCGWATALASLEFVVAQTGNQMGNRCFSCPQAPRIHPLQAANAALDETPSSISSWVAAVRGSPFSDQMPGYCYDWSVPKNAASNRVVTADRCYDHLGHPGVVIVTYADCHVGTIAATRSTPPQGNWTPTTDASPISTSYFSGARSGTLDDNIYDDFADGGGMGLPGQGSSTRAWVR